MSQPYRCSNCGGIAPVGGSRCPACQRQDQLIRERYRILKIESEERKSELLLQAEAEAEHSYHNTIKIKLLELAIESVDSKAQAERKLDVLLNNPALEENLGAFWDIILNNQIILDAYFHCRLSRIGTGERSGELAVPVFDTLHPLAIATLDEWISKPPHYYWKSLTLEAYRFYKAVVRRRQLEAEARVVAEQTARARREARAKRLALLKLLFLSLVCFAVGILGLWFVTLYDPTPQVRRSKASIGRSSRESPFTNTLGMKFVFVTKTNQDSDVLFSIWETRNRDYAVFAAKHGNAGDLWMYPKSDNGVLKHDDNCPVVCVTWGDANSFCKWLTQKERAEGKIPPKAFYRLPTDAEWSDAVGIGGLEDSHETPFSKDTKVGNVYPWKGEYPAKAEGNYGLDSISDRWKDLAPVGSFGSNKLGLYDMGGNVWEFCMDSFGGGFDGIVARGGSFQTIENHDMLASRRKMTNRDRALPDRGFRCVLELPIVDK